MTWIKDKLGNITSILSGTTPNSEEKTYWNGSHVWITPTDLGKLEDILIYSSERLISEEGVKSCNLSLVPRGAVVMSSRAPIGHLGIAGVDLFTNQGCKSFVCTSSIDNEFLYYLLKLRKKDIQGMGSGATFPEVSKGALENFEIVFPENIQDQKKITEQLKAQLAEVEKARKAIEIQLQDVEKLFLQTLEDIFSGLETYKKLKIGDYAPTTSGSTPSRGQKDYWEPAEIPWIKTGEVAFSHITKSEEFVSQKALKECSLQLLPTDTVLVAMYGQGKTRGQAAILKIEATINQACFAVLPNDTWEPEFLFYWFRSSYGFLRKLSADRGGNQSNLNGGIMKSLSVPAPSKPIQREIAQKINTRIVEINKTKTSCELNYNEIKVLPEILLKKAFG